MRAAPEDSRRGARPSRSGLRQRFGAYLRHHRQSCAASLKRLLHQPLGSLMTVAVIAIALALPAGLLVGVDNARQVSGTWQGAARISLYLKQGLSPQAVSRLAGQLRARPGVAKVRVITPEEALAELQQRSGFDAALKLLGTNPLPAVLVIEPAPADSAPTAAAQLGHALAELPEVDQVRMDITWLKRLQAILETLNRSLLLVGVLLALAVVLIVGNTIRLDIAGRRAEIEVSKLLGATDGFIRRPFLYHGLWYGLAGGVLAWLLVWVSLLLLAPPVVRLAGLYGSDFHLSGLGARGSLELLGLGLLLGWLGAWLAVARHLQDIEPI